MRLVLCAAFLSACQTAKPTAKAPQIKRLESVALELVDMPQEGGTTDTGYWPTILTDKEGGLHIAYCDANLGDAKLAHEKKDGGWEVEAVDTKGAVGKYITGDWGPDGPELVYLDQSKKTLRYAWKTKDGWKFQNLSSDNDDIGISGRFRVLPGGERAYVYYNTRNELLLAVGRNRSDTGLVWETSKIAKAGAVHNIVIDVGAMAAGKLAIAYPDWNVSSSTLFFGTVPDLALQKPDKPSTLAADKVDGDAIAGLKTQLVPAGPVYDLLYMTGRGGLLYLAKAAADGWKREQITSNIANLASTTLPGGALAIALQVGKADGLGEGALHYGERSAAGVFSEWVVDEGRPVGQYLSIAATKTRGRVVIAYYDGAKKGLKVARIP